MGTRKHTTQQALNTYAQDQKECKFVGFQINTPWCRDNCGKGRDATQWGRETPKFGKQGGSSNFLNVRTRGHILFAFSVMH